MADGLLKLASGDEAEEVRLEGESASLGRRKIEFETLRRGGRLEAIRIGDESVPVRVARDGEKVFVWCAGEILEFRRAGGRKARTRETGGGLSAPMPGKIRKVIASAGDRIAAGDVVLILEAMKMEHAIRAPVSGTVTKILHSEGDLVDSGALLAEIKADL
jgi:propionyl-CoA carboxylase alpha chain/3-methylcrotonyl-CoA carboxylase alpha subunit